MKDQSKTKQVLIQELASLRQRIAELEQSESDRKNMEEDLRKSEERYRTVARLSSEFAYSCIHAGDDGYEVDWITNAFFTLTGYSEAELHKQRCWLFVSHPDDREMATKPLHELKAGESDTREFRIVTKGGRVLYMISHMECQADPKAPGGLRLFGAVQDITERKLVEEKLRESEELFKSYLENAPDGIYMSDLEGTFLYGNRKCEEIIGYRREELIGKNFLELNVLTENSLNKAVQLLQANMEGKSTGPGEIELISKGGGLIHVEINTNVFQRMGQRIVLASVRDITDRNQAEKALQESEERYRTLVENASDVVFWTDENGYFTFVNPVALRITGYEEKEIIERHYSTLIRPDMREEAMKFFGRQFVKGIQNTYSEYPIIAKDGHELWIGQNTQLIMEEDHVTGFQSVARDITDRKKAEEALRESEKGYRELNIKLREAYLWMSQKKDEIKARKYSESIIFLIADDGRICGFTEEAVVITKKSHSDILGCNIQDIFVFQEGQAFMDLIHKVRPRMSHLTTLRFKNQMEDGPVYEAKLTYIIVEGKRLFYIVLY